MKKSATVSLTHARLREMGVDRSAARRGLVQLERLGLVSVLRRNGAAPRVTIVTAVAHATDGRTTRPSAAATAMAPHSPPSRAPGRAAASPTYVSCMEAMGLLRRDVDDGDSRPDAAECARPTSSRLGFNALEQRALTQLVDDPSGSMVSVSQERATALAGGDRDGVRLRALARAGAHWRRPLTADRSAAHGGSSHEGVRNREGVGQAAHGLKSPILRADGAALQREPRHPPSTGPVRGGGKPDQRRTGCG